MTREMKKQKETDTKLNSGIKQSEKMTAEQKSPKSQMDESGKFFKRSEKHKQVENTDVDNEKNEIVSKLNSGGKGLFRTISNVFSNQSEKTASTENSTPEQKSKSEVDQSGDSFRCLERPKQEEDKKAESWKTSVSNILEKFISKAAKSKFISTAEQLNNIHRRLFVKIWAEVQEDIHIPEKQMGKLDKKLSKSLCKKFQCTEDIMLLFMLINDPVLDDEIVSHFVKHLRTSAVRDSFFSRICKFFSIRFGDAENKRNESTQHDLQHPSMESDVQDTVLVAAESEGEEIPSEEDSEPHMHALNVTSAKDYEAADFGISKPQKEMFEVPPEGDCVLEDNVIDADSVEDFRLEEHVSSFIPVEPLMEKFGPGSRILEVSPVRDIDSLQDVEDVEPKEQQEQVAESFKASLNELVQLLVTRVAINSDIQYSSDEVTEVHNRLFGKIYAAAEGHDFDNSGVDMDKLYKNIFKKLECAESRLMLLLALRCPLVDDIIVSTFVKHLRTSAVRDSFFSCIWKFFSMRFGGTENKNNESTQTDVQHPSMESDVQDTVSETKSESTENCDISESGPSVVSEVFKPEEHVLEVTPEGGSVVAEYIVEVNLMEYLRLEEHMSSIVPVEQLVDKFGPGSYVIEVSPVRDIDSQGQIHTDVQDPVPASVYLLELSLEEDLEPEEDLSVLTPQQDSGPEENLLKSTSTEDVEPKEQQEQVAESFKTSLLELVQLLVSHVVLKVEMQCSKDVIREVQQRLFDQIYTAVEGQHFHIAESVMDKLCKKISKDLCKELQCVEEHLMVLLALQCPSVDDVTVSTFVKHLLESSKKQGFFRRLFS